MQGELDEALLQNSITVWRADEDAEWKESIFRHFRAVNVIEYEGPYAPLDEQALRKACGYANLFLWLSGEDGDHLYDRLTVTLFRNQKNPLLFWDMEQRGTLVSAGIPGVYRVVGYADFPLLVVITGELEGEEYAAFRILTDEAKEADVVSAIRTAAASGLDEAAKEDYAVFLRLVLEINPQYIEAIRRDEAMSDALMEIVGDKRWTSAYMG